MAADRERACLLVRREGSPAYSRSTLHTVSIVRKHRQDLSRTLDCSGFWRGCCIPASEYTGSSLPPWNHQLQGPDIRESQQSGSSASAVRISGVEVEWTRCR